MNDFKFTLNRKGVKALLRSDAMAKGLGKLAQEAAERSGEGYEADTYIGKNRANASVRTKSREAVKDNNQNNTILKNLRG